MITSYASGLPYWPTELLAPLHHHDIFLLRQFGLLLGILEIVAAFFLVRRLVNEISAVCCALMLGCHSAFLYTHTITTYYEAVPWFALTVGALGWLRWSNVNSAKARLWATLSVGLGLTIAFLANIKTILVVAPLGVLALRNIRQWPKIRVWQGLLVFACVLIAFIPLVSFGIIDPSGGLSQQFSSRSSNLLSRFGLQTVILEFYSTLIFGTDMGFYGDMVTGRAMTPWWPPLVIMALALIYPTYALAKNLRNGEGSFFAAICAAEIWTFLFVSAFLYGQFPSANYAPVNPAFPLCIGLSLGVLAKRLQPKFLVPLVMTTMSVFGWNLVRRGDYRRYYDTSINAAAEQEAARFLREHHNDGAAVLTATYNLAGVFESLGAGIVHPIQTEPFISRECVANDKVDTDCLEKHWDKLFSEHALPRPWRIVLPAVFSRVDEPASPAMEHALRNAAALRGISVQTEAEFSTWSGAKVLRIVRIERDKL